MGGRRAFTITEVLITVAMVGIIAAIAVPNYIKTVELGYWRSAQDILRTVYAGEQVYFTVNQKYVSTPGTLANWRAWLYMDNPNTGAGGTVTYGIAAAGAGAGATFTATAKRVGGRCNGKAMTINDQNTLNTAGWNPQNPSC